MAGKSADSSIYIKHLIVLLLVLAVIVVISGRVVPDDHPNMDLHEYRMISAAAPGIDENVPRPFAYRLFGPYIVGLLPVEMDTGYYLMMLILSYALLLLFYNFLRHVGINPQTALFITILYSLNYYQFNYHIYNYFQVTDLLGLICVVALIWAMLRLRWGIFAVVLAFGVTCRETPIIMIPVAFVYLLEKRLLASEGIKFVLSIIPAVAVFILIRQLVPYSGGMGLFEAFTVHIAKFMRPATWLNMLIRPFTPLTLLAIVFYKDMIEFFRGRMYLPCLFTLVCLTTVFGSNTERLMAPAFIVFYLPLAVILQKYFKENRAFMLILLLIVFARTFYHLVAPDSLPSVNSDRVAAVVPTILVFIVGFWYKRQHDRLVK